MKVERATEIVGALGDEWSAPSDQGPLGSRALARHIGVDHDELSAHAIATGTRFARAVEHGATVQAAIRTAYLSAFFAGAIWAKGEESDGT